MADMVSARNEQNREFLSKIKELRRDYSLAETKLSQVYDDRLSGLITAELCRKKMSELEEQQLGIKARIEALERETHRVIQDGLDILDVGEQVARKVEGFTLEQKRRLLMIMMGDAVAKDGKISYKITLPVSLMFELWTGKHPRSYAFSTNIFDRFRRSPIDPMLAGLRGLL